MIGDTILFIKKFIKQQFCINHKYRMQMNPRATHKWWVCTKCNRIKKQSPN